MSDPFEPFVARFERLPFVRRVVFQEDVDFNDPYIDGIVTLATPEETYELPFVLEQSPVIRSRLEELFASARIRPGLILLTQVVGPALGELLEQNAIGFVDLEGSCFLALGTRYIARKQIVERIGPSANPWEGRPSELFQRYHGFMLGFWSRLLALGEMEPRYPAFRSFINELLAELGVDWLVPEQHADYIRLLPRTRRSSRGSCRTLATSWPIFLTSRCMRCTRCWLSNIPRPTHRDSTCGRYPSDMRSTKEPFRTRYTTFYKPALTLAGYETLRAWEGASSEAYINLVKLVMSGCGTALADLSAVEDALPNGNVVHEVGMSMALNHYPLLLRDQRECRLPTNLIGLAIFDYDTSVTGWPAEHANDLGARILELEQARRGEPRHAQADEPG